MAKILMFGNQKGGVGKSQCAILAATALSQAPFNLKVCVIDSDAQKSIFALRNLDVRAYKDVPMPFVVFDFTFAQMQEKINLLDKQYDVIILDVAGKLDVNVPIDQQEITKTLMYVDYLFLPFVAGNFNLSASIEYLKYALQVKSTRKGERVLNVVGFVNMYSITKKNKSLLGKITKLLTATEFLFMENKLGDYTQFSEADSVTSLYARLSPDKAKANFTAWLNEFITIIK